MVARKPVVIGGDGLPQQLQPGDTISGPHAFFTGSANLPAITLIVGNGISGFPDLRVETGSSRIDPDPDYRVE